MIRYFIFIFFFALLVAFFLSWLVPFVRKAGSSVDKSYSRLERKVNRRKKQ